MGSPGPIAFIPGGIWPGGPGIPQGLPPGVGWHGPGPQRPPQGLPTGPDMFTGPIGPHELPGTPQAVVPMGPEGPKCPPTLGGPDMELTGECE